MTSPSRLAAAFIALALVLTGCSTSKQATAPGVPPSEQAPSASEETPSSEDTPRGDREDNEAPAAPEEKAASQAPEDWHHLSAETSAYPGIGTGRAYAFLDGRRPKDTVVVAVLDSGIDTSHEDLDDVLWTNRDEVPGNDQDDDQNGYVDDTHGWNFIGGPDGENVRYDTFELTRLYADLKKKYEGADPANLSSEERNEYERYQKLKEEYLQEKKKFTTQYTRIKNIQGFLEQGQKLVQEHLGSSSPITSEQLARIGPDAPSRVQQAKRPLVALLEQTGAPNVRALLDQLTKAEEQLNVRVKYNLDPSFEPRPIVGDDYADASERRYGNPDVQGPEPDHSTAVAGLIGAERDNDVGIKGISGAVKLMSVRTVPMGDERDKDVANAIRYAVDNGADIINMSFGKGYSPRKQVVDEAVRYADRNGVLMVHAAGNDAANIDSTDSFPTRRYRNGAGMAEHWIEVGASSWQSDSLLAAPFSNYGARGVDLFAPGVSVYVPEPGDAYGRADGTSMAAPVVSGVAALVMAYYPELSAGQVKRAILASATNYAEAMVQRPGRQQDAVVPFGTLSQTGGVVNAYEALRTAEAMSR